jgi:hypothetical protein
MRAHVVFAERLRGVALCLGVGLAGGRVELGTLLAGAGGVGVALELEPGVSPAVTSSAGSLVGRLRTADCTC